MHSKRVTWAVVALFTAAIATAVATAAVAATPRADAPIAMDDTGDLVAPEPSTEGSR